MSHLRIVRGDFLGSPVIRTLCFHLAPQPVKVKMLVAHLCPSLHNPIDCSPPGSSVHGIPQTRILEWVAIPFSRALVQSLVGGLRSCKPHEAAKNKQERKKYEQTVQNTRNTKEYWKKGLPPSSHPSLPASHYPSHPCCQFSFSTEMVVLHCLLLTFFTLNILCNPFFFLPAAQIFHYYQVIYW